MDSHSKDRNKTIGIDFGVVQVLAAFILIAAACVKATHVDRILVGTGTLSSPLFLLTAIAIESGLGVFLFLARSAWCWHITILTFGILSLFSGYYYYSGEQCDCFAGFVDPVVLFVIDCSIVILCVMSRSRAKRSPVILVPAAIGVSCSLFLSIYAYSNHTPAKSDLQPIEFLLAESMTGKKWLIDENFNPLLSQLNRGQWLVFVFRSNCSHCKEFASQVRTNIDTSSLEKTVVFISGENKWPFSFGKISLVFSPDGTITWPKNEPFVASPALFILNDGIVTNAFDGNNIEQVDAKILLEINSH